MAGHEVQKASGAEPRFFYGYIVVVAAVCIMAAVWGVYYAFGVFFKPVLVEFGWSSAITAGAFSVSMFLRGFLGIIAGGLNDRYGPRIVITFCGLILGIAYLLMSQVNAIWQLYLFYGVLIGVGISGFYVPPLSTVARWFTKRRSLMTGIVLAGMSFGALLIPPIANKLIYTYDWRTSYIIFGILILVVVLITAQFLRRDPKQMGQVPYGENEDVKQRFRLATGGFSIKEAACTSQFWMVGAMVLCRGFVEFAIIVHIVPHAVDMGTSSAGAANILAAIGGLAIAGRVILGSTADRIGNKQALIIGFILLSAALFWLMPAIENWMLYLFAVVFGFSQGGMGAIMSPLVAGLFGLGSHGIIFGIISFIYSIGAAIGPFLAGYIFDINGSYYVAIWVCAVLGIAGLILTVFLKPIKGEHSQNEVLSTT